MRVQFGLTAACLMVGSLNTQVARSQGSTELPEIKRRLERAERTLKDWPNLARYHEANSLLPPGNEARVVFMGDSITDNWSHDGMGGFFPGKPYINRGISGQTTPQMLVRFRPDVIDLKPKVVVILAGTNDIAGNTGPMSLENIEENLASMSELARAHDIRTVLASLLPVGDESLDQNHKPRIQTQRRPPAQIAALNTWIRRYVKENGHTFLDYYGALLSPQGTIRGELTDDGLHPNAQGYKVMGPLAEKAIAEALARKD